MTDTPPPLPFRCGTMLATMTSDERDHWSEVTHRMEQEYVDWVRAHSNPRGEWLRRVKILEQRAAFAAEATSQRARKAVNRELEDAETSPEEEEIITALTHQRNLDCLALMVEQLGVDRVLETVDRLDRRPHSTGWGAGSQHRTNPWMAEFVRGRALSSLLGGWPASRLLLGINAHEAYAFEIRRCFGGGVVFRVARRDDQILLCGFAGGRPNDGWHYQEKQWEVSESEWRDLITPLEQFWDLPNFEPPQGLDGETWAVEGRRDGRSHRVERWCPQRRNEGQEFAVIGEAFLALAKVTW